MRRLLPILAFAALPLAASAAAQDLVGEYRLAEGPDVGGGLLIAADGSFQYGLAAGALDEFSKGRWEADGERVCLITDPKPVAPAFAKAEPVAVEGIVPTILVTWPNGEPVSGVDFLIGFDSGEPAEGYTQYNGWSLPDDEHRVPRWIEVHEPIYDIDAPRFELGEADKGRLHVRLIPNDLGLVDLTGACLAARERGVVLTRREGEMRFVRVEADVPAGEGEQAGGGGAENEPSAPPPPPGDGAERSVTPSKVDDST